MSARNGNYSFLKGLVDRVHELNNYTDQVLMKSKAIMKSEDGGSVTEMTPEAINVAIKNSKAEDEICIQLQDLFDKLTSDFRAKSITAPRYKDYLAEFKRLLTDGNKLITNRNLNVGEIVKELKKTPFN